MHFFGTSARVLCPVMLLCQPYVNRQGPLQKGKEGKVETNTKSKGKKEKKKRKYKRVGKG